MLNLRYFCELLMVSVLCSHAWYGHAYSVEQAGMMPREVPAISEETHQIDAAILQENGDVGAAIESLAAIRFQSLERNDLMIGGVAIGDSVDVLHEHFGSPLKVKDGNRYKYYTFKNAKAVYQKELPYTKDISEKIGVMAYGTKSGIISLYTETKDFPTSRGLVVGSSRENILRVYGQPTMVFHDPQSKSTYYMYRLEQDEMQIAFEVRNLQVRAIRSERITKKSRPVPEKDEYRLVGMKVGEIYRCPVWTDWEIHAVGNIQEFWFFTDFGVSVDRHTGRIERIFLLSPNLTTTKGVTIGDSLSTIEHIYGKPDKIDRDETENLEVYYYTDHNNKKARMVFVIDMTKKVVLDILLTMTDLSNFATKEERYGLG